MNANGKRVVIGMSGGVDSSVSALILKNQGYDVIGVTIDMFEKNDCDSCSSCISSTTVTDSKAVCNKLGISHHVISYKDIFKANVIDYFANEYISGRTPNPCVMCNRYVKFESLLNTAKNQFNADYIATGHYAKIEYDSDTNRYYLKESVTSEKDQTYVLYNLTQQQLKHIIMPLGDYNKEQVREIARENGLVNANKSDSQEICFIPDNDYAKYIEESYGYTSIPGNFTDMNGNVLGMHKGIIHYTIGQRRGLGLSLKAPLYVVALDINKNEVVLGPHEALFSNTLICTKPNFMPFERLLEPMIVTAKIRYSAKKVQATISPLENGNVQVKFDEPQRAITPGQAVVFYDGNSLIGGGIII